MQIIPKLIPIMDDEELTSYLCRLSEANYPFYRTNGHDAFSAGITFIPKSYAGIMPYLENIADQLDIDFLSLLYNHTMFLPNQIYKTRLELKKTVRSMFSIKENTSRQRLLSKQEFYYCPECVREDEVAHGFHYVHMSHQLSPGFCWKHHCETSKDTAEHILHMDISRLDPAVIAPPALTPSLIERNTTAMKQEIMAKRLVIDYEDAVTLIELDYQPMTMFAANTALELENRETDFPHASALVQASCLSDAYRYLLAAQKNGYSLALYPNLFSALLSESLNGKELKDVLPPAEEIYKDCVLSAAKQSYTILAKKLEPIIKVKHITTGAIKYVSVYSVLDEFIDPRPRVKK